MIIQYSFYVDWSVLAMHQILVFSSISIIIFTLFKSKKVKWWNVTIIGLLIIVILILAPETYIEYLCCSTDAERSLLSFIFFIGLVSCLFLIVYLIHLRNENLRKEYNINSIITFRWFLYRVLKRKIMLLSYFLKISCLYSFKQI